MGDFEHLIDDIATAGLVYEDAIAWAAGIDVESTPTPWFERSEEYGERAWRLVGKDVAVVCWDCGNGWMDIMTLEPLASTGPHEFRAAAVRFYNRLSEAMENPDLNGGNSNAALARRSIANGTSDSAHLCSPIQAKRCFCAGGGGCVL